MSLHSHKLLLFTLLFSVQVFSNDIEIKTYSYPIESDSLWKHLYSETELPSGITNLKVDFPTYWASNQAGSYKNIPEIGNYQMSDGIVLSNGNAIDCKGPNDQNAKTGQGGFPGDADLNKLVGYSTYDAASFMISFDSDSTVNGFSFTYAFGSEEYPSYIGSEFNDVFVVILDGENICVDENGYIISINNTLFNIDNINPPSINLQWNGFTYVMSVSIPLSPGSHTIKFAVADVTDFRIDSGVFLSNFKFSYDALLNTPMIDIVKDQSFSIPTTVNSGTIIGQIQNRSLFSPTILQMISENDYVYLDGWDIVSKKDFTMNIGESLNLTLEGKLDTIWNQKPWLVVDTCSVTLNFDNTTLQNLKSSDLNNNVNITSYNSSLKIDLKNFKNASISIYDMKGKCIRKHISPINSHDDFILLKHNEYSQGSYVGVVKKENQIIQNFKFVIN